MTMMMMMMMMAMVSEAVRTPLIARDRTIGLHDVLPAELAHYDGILLWRVSEYKRSKREAVTGT